MFANIFGFLVWGYYCFSQILGHSDFMVDLYSFFQVDVWALGVSAIEMAEVFLLLVNVEHFRGSKKKKNEI